MLLLTYIYDKLVNNYQPDDATRAAWEQFVAEGQKILDNNKPVSIDTGFQGFTVALQDRSVVDLANASEDADAESPEAIQVFKQNIGRNIDGGAISVFGGEDE